MTVASSENQQPLSIPNYHQHAPGSQNQESDQLEKVILIFRWMTPILLIGTLVLTFGTRAFSRFVLKLQNVGYESLPDSNFERQTTTGRGEREILSSTHQPNRHLNPPQPEEEAGIVPVVVPLRKPRRNWIYAVHGLIILSYFFDGLVICVRAVWAHCWEPSEMAVWRALDGYVVSCLVAFVGCIVAMSWEERGSGQLGGWGKIYTRVFSTQALLGEMVIGISCLVLLTRSPQSNTSTASPNHTSIEPYDLLHAINLSVRLLLVISLSLLQTKFLYHKEFVSLSSLRPSTAEVSPERSAGGYGTFVPSNGSNAHVLSTKAQMREAPKPTGVLKMMKRVKILFPYLWPRRSRALQAVALCCFLLLFVGRAVNLMVPMTLGEATEDLSQSRSPWLHLAAYVGLRFLQGSGGIINVILQSLWVPVAQYADRSMSMMSFRHILDLSLSYHTRRKTAEVLRILDRGSAINQFFQMLFFSLIPIVLDIGLAVGYLAIRFDIFLAGMLLFIMIAYAAVSVLLTQWRTAIRREMVDKDKYTRGIQGDSLLNWETIAWFNTKTFETNRYLDATIDYQRSEFMVMSSLYTLNLAQNAIISVALLIGCFAVAFQVSTGRKTVGDFVLFVSYVAQLVGPLNQLGTLYRVIQQNLTDTDNLMKLLAEPKEIEDRPNAQTIIKAKGTIEFDHVGFSYDGKSSALEDISFTVPAGSSVALVGESGSGKSTILRLLFRFYDPTAGSIKLDGVDIRDLTQASYRSQIGSVPQDAALFNDTIRYNIGYGAIGVKPDGPTMEDVVEAAKAAQIHNRIMSFPDGYETRVGERGVRLSGGEKQRVAIARVMIRNPPVILLDEATSALDTTTEREIQEALQKLGQGRTTVAIAHRLSTIVNSDIILVIGKGRIVEKGTHSDLLALKGLYSDLWAKQIRAEVEAGGSESLLKPPVVQSSSTSSSGGESEPAIN
ncbi:hypothetical protein PGT21_017145 [Puccinia graminis f. sp. tritici]|uniref:Uncharacterized protein n=2 Tax=Puccinia graminis f. sp. tritici TaxID=56615 RepID=A0A5B0LQY7_PUCGR|nr:hypothetical protein PGT21_017145 [Puccinia graminis f. sp. tritici]KAA1130493.1 hypothetical protein PGTUg99_008544 [Puccinia graminis f. sp. tritici]